MLGLGWKEMNYPLQPIYLKTWQLSQRVVIWVTTAFLPAQTGLSILLWPNRGVTACRNKCSMNDLFFVPFCENTIDSAVSKNHQEISSSFILKYSTQPRTRGHRKIIRLGVGTVNNSALTQTASHPFLCYSFIPIIILGIIIYHHYEAAQLSWHLTEPGLLGVGHFNLHALNVPCLNQLTDRKTVWDFRGKAEKCVQCVPGVELHRRTVFCTIREQRSPSSLSLALLALVARFPLQFWANQKFLKAAWSVFPLSDVTRLSWGFTSRDSSYRALFFKMVAFLFALHVTS